MPSPKPRPAGLPQTRGSPDSVDGPPEPVPGVQPELTRPTPLSRTPSRSPTDEDVSDDLSTYYNAPYQPVAPPPSRRKPPPSRETVDYPTLSADAPVDGPRTESYRNTTVAASMEELESDLVATARVPARSQPATSPSGSATSATPTTAVPHRSSSQSPNEEIPQAPLPPYQSANPNVNYQQQQQYNPTMNQSYPYPQSDGYPSTENFITSNGSSSIYHTTASSQTTLVASYPLAGSAPRGNVPSLVPIELPITRIRVLASHIRANDRGKDVLAFSIQVQPGQREPWIIEKMYSDVLALDSRVRTLLNKSTLKRLAPLPDPKLFKDNAPAKVDQRKMLLEQYLQSVVIAPLKDVGDLCAFFCSDLNKGDRAPVSSQGYKEGYLTKRGKNFGGWRTRYFILQNGLLEYFENVSLLFVFFRKIDQSVM
jgi:RalA-binding protein 1